MTALETISAATPAGVRAVFTTRRGGASLGPWTGLNLSGDVGDAPTAVTANREALAADLGIDPARVAANRQEHGSRVTMVFGDEPGLPETGDVLATGMPRMALQVYGADCLPILAWRRDGRLVGAAHAGWRGLTGGVVAALVGALGHGSEIEVAIGPGIGPCCYPVEPGVRWMFESGFGPEVVVGEAVDLPGAARLALIAAGVEADGIEVVRACTSCDAGGRFYSHRRDGQPTGRQAGLIWRDVDPVEDFASTE